jgi:hypothetical protein
MDGIVYDMAQNSEASPSFFVKKDYLSILDNMNGIYSSNQCIIDSSQISNSNKWASYREAYLQIPLLLTMTSSAVDNLIVIATNIDYSVSLKNWYGSMIHSISVDLQGSTIIQQTPFQSLWNCFRLLTTLSYQSLVTEGPTIGFYPDTSTSFSYNAVPVAGGHGVCNNSNFYISPPVSGANTTIVINSGAGKRDYYNKGMYERQRVWNYAPNTTVGTSVVAGPLPQLYSSLLTQNSANTIFKSGIFNKTASTTAGVTGVWQAQIQSIVFLRHLHSFFDKAPLMKGIYFRMTLTLNNASSTAIYTASATQVLTAINVPSGGVNPLLIASNALANGSVAKITGGSYFYNISVGADCLDPSIKSTLTLSGQNRNISLNVPVYTFNPIFESAYISNSVRKIQYEDIYQYQVLNVKAGAQFNNLITNGIAGLKSCLVIPFFNATAANSNIGALAIPPFQSPFDPCGGGPTSPMAMLNNFNVVVSGQNVLYNNQRYTYENFIQQLNGQNAINGNLVDGMGSSLISQVDFENTYCYYYVDLSRCLPIEVGVSKSVNIIGQNMSVKDLDLYVYLAYSCEVTIDVLVGSRL